MSIKTRSCFYSNKEKKKIILIVNLYYIQINKYKMI